MLLKHPNTQHFGYPKSCLVGFLKNDLLMVQNSFGETRFIKILRNVELKIHLGLRKQRIMLDGDEFVMSVLINQHVVVSTIATNLLFMPLLIQKKTRHKCTTNHF